MRLLLIADTHLPKRAKDLPPQVWDAVDDADVVIHAGDVFAIAPGHDAEVIGDEPCMLLDFGEFGGYAKRH